jgi:hypothetical protein
MLRAVSQTGLFEKELVTLNDKKVPWCLYRLTLLTLVTE